jgi:spoIIIJ-associated protein
MKTIERAGRTVDEAIAAGLQELGVPSERVRVEVLDEGKGGFLGIGARPSLVRLTLKESRADRVEAFLNQVCGVMGLQATVNVTTESDHLQADVEAGDEGRVLIGHHGQTLDAIQYLCNLVASKAVADGPRILVDVEGYRKRRAETLNRLAARLAERVKRTGESTALEPMSAHERRVIHLALQDDPDVVTTSEGEDPFRRVVIQPKR